MSGVEIDTRAFHARALALAQAFRDLPHLFGNADTLIIAVGASDEENPYQKAPALQLWLLGYEFTDTVFALLRDGSLLILTSAKKATYLEPLTAVAGGIKMTLMHRTKDDSKLPELFDLCKASGQGKTIGTFSRDKMSGKFATEWSAALSASGLTTVDATPGAALVLATKDSSEVKLVHTGSKISAAIMKNYVLEEIMSIIDDGKQVTHEQLAGNVDSVLGEQMPKFAKRLKFPADTDLGVLEWCYFPVVQSGGKYDLRPSAMSDGEQLHAGTILCSLGVRYKSYCTNVGRTLLINPTKQQERNYEFLIELANYVLTILRPGIKCKDVYSEAQAYVRSKRPDLEPFLVKSLGFGTGIEFRELQYVLNAKNEAEIPTNAVFNLSIGFQNLTNDAAADPKNKVYALHLADTALVMADKSLMLTGDCTRDAAEVCLFFEDDEPAAAKSASSASAKQRADAARSIASNGSASGGAAGRVKSEPLARTRGASAVLKDKTRKQASAVEESAVAKRRDHQRELARRKQDEGMERFAAGNGKSSNKDKATFKRFESYKNFAMMPKEAGLNIWVDRRQSSVCLPLYGISVPFHINTIKNVTKNDEGEFVHLRFNFVVPGQTIGRKEETPFENPDATFIKTLSFRSKDVKHMSDLAQAILDLKKEATKAEAERKDKADMVEQDRLVEVSKFKPVALYDVYARPTLDGKRLPGDLEIHANGLRYRSRIKAENRIDILFNNIQHLFFQPCDHELIVILHVHLKNPIMVGKKKTRDVQFYKEVSDAAFDETGNRRRRQTYGDEDELQQEQEERRRRVKLNKEFKDFAEKISDQPEAAKNGIALDIPFRELAFTGVPHRANVLLQPTQDCLVHLTDPPFTVITLADIEVVHLERIQFGLKNFDMVFVFKEYSKAPVHINSIPANELELVREWLDTNDILFSEGPVNLNWAAIMKTINDDPAAFFEETGWSFLQAGSDDEDGGSSESASEFEASGSDMDMSDDDDESSAYSGSDGSDFDEDDSGSGSGSGGGSEDESGEDWDEMEEKLMRKEKKRGYDSDDDDRGTSRKKARR
ncbi:FACT complex component Spt16 [Catenaria anguillulae PL171]|uniref:FACT complex subunit n=1 Tax=Catenaria anguillulae PL171 TaxID=765915 RepID=A0A1Y2HXS0_9FUNG|nr:FACT complex component Spt16 [Catenaria anguillulae PL171]